MISSAILGIPFIPISVLTEPSCILPEMESNQYLLDG